MGRRPKRKREKVSFRESVDLAQDYWDGFAGDGFGLSIVLMPVTCSWYYVRGHPPLDGRGQQRDATKVGCRPRG